MAHSLLLLLIASLFIFLPSVSSRLIGPRFGMGSVGGGDVGDDSHSKSVCDRFNDLPEECSCYDPGHYRIVLECLKPFRTEYFNDTIGIKVDMDPCDPEGSRMDLDVVEVEHGIDYTISGIKAGEERNIPIPGLSIIVPGLGHVGIDAAVLIEGNPDMLRMRVGLNACVAVGTQGHAGQICASSIPGLRQVLPWYVLSGTYSFGDFCERNTNEDEEREIPGVAAME